MLKRYVLLVGLLIIVSGALAACSPEATPVEPSVDSSMDNGGMDMADAPAIPSGLAYADGQDVRFIHTEVSDPDVAALLSDMMSSPVLYVPSLAEAPVTAPVYVFNNGVEGMGPLGYQPDIFGDLPGSDTYTPLRKIVFVTWNDAGGARELKSVTELMEAESNGEVILNESGVVVNMPFVVWPGGTR